MMAGGIVCGADRSGNAKVRPSDGGRMIILSHSAGKGFLKGMHVLYEDIQPGNTVDFAARYMLPPQLRDLPLPGAATDAFAVRVRNAISSRALNATSIIIAYDPAHETGRSGNFCDPKSWLHYLAMSRSAEAADAVVSEINHIFHPNGRYGIIHRDAGLSGRHASLFGVTIAGFAAGMHDRALSHHDLALVPITGMVRHTAEGAFITLPVMEVCLRQAALVVPAAAKGP